MDVLLWRQWVPRYAHSLVFSALEHHGVGGTELQLLWHARQLAAMGHRVQVLGATSKDTSEEDIDFVGAADRRAQEAVVSSGRVRKPAVILLEGCPDAAPWFRGVYPHATIIHVGQNIDPYGHRQAFAFVSHVDLFAFVSPGHLGEYCVRFPHLRHKFVLLRNCVPWHGLYHAISPLPVRDHVVWVGSWSKKGIRQWAATMERVLRERRELTWTLCGPSYGAGTELLPPEVFAGLRFPSESVSVKTLPLAPLAAELSSARIVLVSLGNETAGISVLDAHAMGRPTISGNDVVYKYNNPDGVGVRVTTGHQCYEAITFLLDRPELCDKLGVQGRQLVLDDYTERSQENDLRRILAYLELREALGPLASYQPTSYFEDRAIDLRDKLVRKWNKLRTHQSRAV